MLKVEKLDSSQFDEVKGLLAGFPGRWTEDDWRRIFDYRWDKEENYCGLVLKDQDTPVGFLGLIFSRKQIGPNVEKFCNITSWIVKEEYRSRALALIFPILAMKDYTITDLSPSSKVHQLQNKLGFDDLDTACRILLPFGRRLSQPNIENLEIATNKIEIEKGLQGEHLRIFRDHKIYNCLHLLVHHQNKYCYITFSKLKRKRIRFAHVHYISDPALFSRAYPKIRKAINTAANSKLVFIDSRHVKNMRLPVSITLPFRSPRQYRSSSLKPEQIDNLYSEVMLLDLVRYPKFRYLVQHWRQRVFSSE